MKMYFIAVVLPEALHAKIQVFKTLMLQRWGCKVGLKSPAHITLVPPFRMEAGKEENLLTDLDAVCKNVPAFTIDVSGFSAFKPRTIFIEPVLHAPLKNLKETMDAFCKTHAQYGAKADTRAFHPHITIATRDLHKHAFAEAWAYFENKEYNASFTAAGLGVLRHNTTNWEVIHTAPFKNE